MSVVITVEDIADAPILEYVHATLITHPTEFKKVQFAIPLSLEKTELMIKAITKTRKLYIPYSEYTPGASSYFCHALTIACSQGLISGREMSVTKEHIRETINTGKKSKVPRAVLFDHLTRNGYETTYANKVKFWKCYRQLLVAYQAYILMN